MLKAIAKWLFIAVVSIVLIFVVFAPLLDSKRQQIPQELAIAEEYIFDDEDETARELAAVLEGSISKRYQSSISKRDAHPKTHGCVKAEFTVNQSQAEHLKVGLFSQNVTYPAYIRFSTGSGRVESDTQKEFLGMGVKVMGVPGEKLLEDEQYTQDFLMISTNQEAVRTSKEFLKVVKASLAGNPLSYFLNPTDLHLKEFKVAAASKKNHSSPLDLRYWSTTPYLFGEGNAVKYSVKRCDTPTGKLPEKLSDNYLREAMKEQLSKQDICFDFMVQFQKDSYDQPIEDAFVEWKEEDTPFISVAKIIIPMQKFDTEGMNTLCENMSLNPWHARLEHRPLGNMNRARKFVYSHIANFRRNKNGVDTSEPEGNEVF